MSRTKAFGMSILYLEATETRPWILKSGIIMCAYVELRQTNIIFMIPRRTSMQAIFRQGRRHNDGWVTIRCKNTFEVITVIKSQTRTCTWCEHWWLREMERNMLYSSGKGIKAWYRRQIPISTFQLEDISSWARFQIIPTTLTTKKKFLWLSSHNTELNHFNQLQQPPESAMFLFLRKNSSLVSTPISRCCSKINKTKKSQNPILMKTNDNCIHADADNKKNSMKINKSTTCGGYTSLRKRRKVPE